MPNTPFEHSPMMLRTAWEGGKGMLCITTGGLWHFTNAVLSQPPEQPQQCLDTLSSVLNFLPLQRPRQEPLRKGNSLPIIFESCQALEGMPGPHVLCVVTPPAAASSPDQWSHSTSTKPLSSMVGLVASFLTVWDRILNFGAGGRRITVKSVRPTLKPERWQKEVVTSQKYLWSSQSRWLAAWRRRHEGPWSCMCSFLWDELGWDWPSGSRSTVGSHTRHSPLTPVWQKCLTEWTYPVLRSVWQILPRRF